MVFGVDYVFEEEDEVERNIEVISDEGFEVERDIIGFDEDIEVFGKSDEVVEEECNVCVLEVKGCFVREGVFGNILCFVCFDEVDVSDEEGDLGEDIEDCGEVDEVNEDFVGVV